MNRHLILVDFPAELHIQFKHIANLLDLNFISTTAAELTKNPTEEITPSHLVAHFIESTSREIPSIEQCRLPHSFHFAVGTQIGIEAEVAFISAGFRGALSRYDDVTRKLDAVNLILKGQVSFSHSAMSKYILQRKPTSTYKRSAQLLALTTPKEQQVLSLIWSGFTNEEMANKLDISVNTIKMHVQNIYKKTNIKNRGQLFALTAS